MQQRVKPKNTLHKTYQRDLPTGYTSIHPQWVDVMAVAHLRDDWHLFVNVLVGFRGIGVSKIKVKIPLP